MKRRRFLQAALASTAVGAALRSPFAESAGAASSVRAEQLHGRHALFLQNSLMRIGVLTGGGFIGEVSLRSPDPLKRVNPMRVPHYPTIDPYAYDVRKHGSLYGTGIQRRLMSGYMGQFTCFPQFAASSAAELAQDYGQHGEALAVRWRRARATHADELVMRAELPMTQYAFERRIRLPAGHSVAYVTETAENLLRFDRPLQWVQHATFGPPFVQVGKAYADASVDRMVTGRGKDATLAPWPEELRVFSGRTTSLLLQREGWNWCTLYNPEHGVLIGYLFEAPRNPWLLDYQEDRRVAEKPWDNKVVMRGLCFGDSMTSGLRNAVTQGASFGVPTYSWIAARQTLSQRYAIFLAEIPADFQGVAQLDVTPKEIVLVERRNDRRIALANSNMW